MASEAPSRTLFVIGFGAVGQAWYKFISHVNGKGLLRGVSSIRYFAPEIKEHKVDGSASLTRWAPSESRISWRSPPLANPRHRHSPPAPIAVFEFNNCEFVTRETLVPLLDRMSLAKGDIVIELATRICTHTIWRACKSRGVHFMNSGFDVWPDITLDLDLMNNIAKDAIYTKGTGPTSVFSFGCNPGIASHFVRHDLFAATGIEDTRAAAKAFGLKSISFNERDTQWPLPGSKGEATFLSTQLDVLYNTWSPGNYIVETGESTILYAGCPEEAKTISSAGPAVVAWTPSGPNIGFMAPHDETFTIQEWFDELIPAVFVYEAPPTARAYLKGGRPEHSSKATCKLLSPAPYDIAPEGYDELGCILFSSKPDVAPFWCGISLNVKESLVVDPTGSVGPTPLQVTGGVWAALQFILQSPDSGDCFPEEVPTPFVVANAFPWAGTLVARPCPEVLAIPGLFDPGATDASLNRIMHGEPKAEFTRAGPSAIHGQGLFAARPLPVSTAVAQLPYEGGSPFAVLNAAAAAAGGANHSATANAYVDRNRAVRTSRPIAEGEEITVNYSLLANDPVADAAVALSFAGPVSSLDKGFVAETIKHYPIIGDGHLRKLIGVA